jgi:hypothetical protein
MLVRTKDNKVKDLDARVANDLLRRKLVFSLQQLPKKKVKKNE